MTGRKAYGWHENGKFYLSLYPANTPNRTKNEYESEQALRLEVKNRRMELVWEHG